MPRNMKRVDKFRFFKMARLLVFPCFLLGLAFLPEESTGVAATSLVFFAAFGCTVLFTTFWPCPSCGRLFCTKLSFGFRGGNWPFRNTCVHCKKSVAEINAEENPPDPLDSE